MTCDCSPSEERVCSFHVEQGLLLHEELTRFDTGRRGTYAVVGAELGRITDEKKKQYGDSAERAGAIMAVLYPDGVPVAAFPTALLVVRICDKLCRIATQDAHGVDGAGEDAWKDIAGYGLIGSQAKR